jgi:hypothetical protein
VCRIVVQVRVPVLCDPTGYHHRELRHGAIGGKLPAVWGVHQPVPEAGEGVHEGVHESVDEGVHEMRVCKCNVHEGVHEGVHEMRVCMRVCMR